MLPPFSPSAQDPSGNTPSHMGAEGPLRQGWLGWQTGTSRDLTCHQSKCPHKGSQVWLPQLVCGLCQTHSPPRMPLSAQHGWGVGRGATHP